jgi:8-oxo-dGTP pyrophosphatase MutT (NUDIX family)
VRWTEKELPRPIAPVGICRNKSAYALISRNKKGVRLTTAFQIIKRRCFWVLSRSALAAYSRLPLFGWLHASVGVIRTGQLVLVIDRSDGRGLSFPGGLAMPWETAEQAMKREVSEETGLAVKQSVQLFEYRNSADVPVELTVFAVEAEGELRDSWEGSPCWLPFTEIRQHLLPSQREIVDRLL